MAKELSLDENRLLAVFNGFPGIYRKSARVASNGQRYYSLQARYAQREGGDVSDPDEISWIRELTAEKLKLLIDFVIHMAEQEQLTKRTRWTNFIAVAAALVAAAAAVVSTFIRQCPNAA